MDIDDDTTVFQTLKSYNAFISQSDALEGLHSAGCGTLQSQYKRSMEVVINLRHHRHHHNNNEQLNEYATSSRHVLQFLGAAERHRLQNSYHQLDQEKKQMELSHKRARFELEKTALDSAKELEVRVKHVNQKFIPFVDLTLTLFCY